MSPPALRSQEVVRILQKRSPLLRVRKSLTTGINSSVLRSKIIYMLMRHYRLRNGMLCSRSYSVRLTPAILSASELRRMLLEILFQHIKFSKSFTGSFDAISQIRRLFLRYCVVPFITVALNSNMVRMKNQNQRFQLKSNNEASMKYSDLSSTILSNIFSSMLHNNAINSKCNMSDVVDDHLPLKMHENVSVLSSDKKNKSTAASFSSQFKISEIYRRCSPVITNSDCALISSTKEPMDINAQTHCPETPLIPLLRLVCKSCHKPLICQSSLSVFKDEALIHEVGVSSGRLQVKWCKSVHPHNQKEKKLLFLDPTLRISKIMSCDDKDLCHLLLSLKRRMKLIKRPCSCADKTINVISCNHWQKLECSEKSKALYPSKEPLNKPSSPFRVKTCFFVKIFKSVVRELLLHCNILKKNMIAKELDRMLSETSIRSKSRDDLQNHIDAARKATKWLLCYVNEILMNGVNEQLKAITTYLHIHGSRHESLISLQRLKSNQGSILATRNFIHYTVKTLISDSRCSNVDIRNSAKNLLVQLQVSSVPNAIYANLLLRGILTGTLWGNQSCPIPETFVHDIQRLKQSGLVLNTAAVVASISTLITGRAKGIGSDRTSQLLVLLKEQDLSVEHVVSQVLHWADKSRYSSSLEGSVRAVLESRSPLKVLYLRRGLQALNDVCEVRRTGGVLAPEIFAARMGMPFLGEYLDKKAAAPLLALTNYSACVYFDAYRAFTVEALGLSNESQI